MTDGQTDKDYMQQSLGSQVKAGMVGLCVGGR